MRAWTLTIGAIVVFAGCGGAASTAPPPATAAQPVTAAGEVARGATLYAEHCAKCHGDHGQGTKKAPPVVGKDALPLDPRPGQKRSVAFHTAADVYGYVKAKMPGDDPGSLSDADYLAILAFDLHANGVDLHGQPLDAASAAGIQLH